jgi:hypothetical protein
MQVTRNEIDIQTLTENAPEILGGLEESQQNLEISIGSKE